MSLELAPQHSGLRSIELPLPQRIAAIRYIEALRQKYPALADEITAGPGNEGIVYVYAPLPQNDDDNIELHETMAEIAVDILLDTGISIALMPTPE